VVSPARPPKAATRPLPSCSISSLCSGGGLHCPPPITRESRGPH
jgi:hypothetical protein